MLLNDLLARLSAFEPNGFPVISLYLDTSPDQHGRDNYGAFVRKEFRARAKTLRHGSSERESFDRDVERITAWLQDELKPSANSVAIFACAAADLFETIELEVPLGSHRLYVYNQPHLYQLARLNDEYPRYAAAICDSNSARLFVFGLGQVLAKEEVRNTRTRSSKVGGWSQARYQRHIENYHVQHAKEIVEALDRTVREDNIRHVILAGDEAIVPKLREQLPRHLEEKVIDVLRVDINAQDAEILQATLDSLREQDAQDDAERVDRLAQEYRAGGLAVAGPRQTLAALEVGQVDELLIGASLEELHGEEREIEEPLAMAGAAGGAEGIAATRTVLLADELVTKATQTSARVRFIEDADLLAWAGGAAAFLRYKT